MDDFNWLTDKQGINFGGHGLFLTPRDMAKLGFLYINNGIWDGTQIVSAEWIQNITQTSWTFSGSWGYGQQWWTHPSLHGYSARGRYGQTIIVLPEVELILVFTAALSDADPDPYFTIIDNYIFPSLLNQRPYIYTIIFVPSTIALASAITIVIWLSIKKKRIHT
ncbi:MAG: serine hydrolase [Asgard group archaeon]|nr:serine hydrolase [Asgard group archaeon]